MAGRTVCRSAAYSSFSDPDASNGSIPMIQREGQRTKAPFCGDGVTLPWGIAVDGDDNVWVVNFNGRSISHFCEFTQGNCPPGARTGPPISPETGDTFDGLTRDTRRAR